jgi:hypothetical protein
VTVEIARENEWIGNFQRTARNEFNKASLDIEKEMDNRFAH